MENNFWCYVSTDKYSVGCTGSTVHLYDSYGNRLAKFKDVPHSYTAMFSPDEKTFVVKTTEGRLAVYSAENKYLIKKFRFSNVDSSQDDGFCFSADGKFFYNIERQKNELNPCISVYDTETFSLVSRYLDDGSLTAPCFIEADKNGELFILGYSRNKRLILDKCFVAKFEDGTLKDIRYIPENEFNFYREYKLLELSGFSKKALEFADKEIINKTDLNRKPLCELWKNKI